MLASIENNDMLCPPQSPDVNHIENIWTQTQSQTRFLVLYILILLTKQIFLKTKVENGILSLRLKCSCRGIG